MDVPVEDVQTYITSDLFKINAVAYLLFGKGAKGKRVDEILDMIEDEGLNDVELEEIVGWVRQRTLNFMLKEAEESSKALQKILPQATELSNTLNGSLV